MRLFYLAPTDLIANSEIGVHQALACPDPTMCLLVVEQWVNDVAQDTFEAHPTVMPVYPWDASKPAPPSLVAAFTSVKPSSVADISAADTVGSALWKIRAAWPAARY